jgi:hypothetical protein
MRSYFNELACVYGLRRSLSRLGFILKRSSWKIGWREVKILNPNDGRSALDTTGNLKINVC